MSAPIDSLADIGIIAVIRAPSADIAVDAVRAVVRGGVRGIEITYTTPDATAAIARISAEFADDVLLGAGTLRSPSQVADAVAAGARFLVSPGYDLEVAEAMSATGRTVMIGAITPTEVMAAERAGAHAVKLFPASLHGPALLRNLRGPFPETAFVPTGGITIANLGDWVKAGAVALGAGGELVSRSDLAGGRFDTITRRARGFVEACRAARGALR